MGRLIYDERNGYQFVSDNGVLYDLLEGKSLKGETTSDIVFVMLSCANFSDEDYNNNIFISYFKSKYGNINQLVGWFYGASFIKDEDFLCMVKEYVIKFEKEKSAMIGLIYNHNMIDRIRKTVNAYLEINMDVLDIREKIDLENQIKYLSSI